MTDRAEPAPLATMDTLDWDRFVDCYWDRRPVLFTSLPAVPFEPQQVFEATVLRTRPPSPGVMPAQVQFTIERDQQLTPGDWLPAGPDGSFAGYQRRLATRLAGRRYALVVHAFHTVHAAQWQRERDFYAGLWERVGLPMTGAITTLFHGSYEHSPVGVHLDRFATFMYALSGRKRMRFWPARPWSLPVTSMLDYQPYLDSSFPVEVAPGQLLYWPASYYHVGEGDLTDQPATSVNVGVPRGGHHAAYDLEDFLYDQLPARLLSDQADPAGLPPDPGGLLVPPAEAGPDLADRLAPALTRALAAFRSAAGDEQLRERITVLSLRRWTAGGFHPPPPPDPPRALGEGDTVRAVVPIRWAERGPGRLCAANGHVARTTLPADQLAGLLERLGSGAPVPVAELPEAGRGLLEELAGFRALTVAPDGDPNLRPR